MRFTLTIRTLMLSTLLLLTWIPLRAQNQAGKTAAAPAGPQAMSARFEDLKWQVMMPDLGKDSPLITILRIDPHTKATQLLIRTPSAIHVPLHWHSANETHTTIRGTAVFEHEGKRVKLGPGGFNYIPAKMHHQAWLSADSMVFITVDSGWDVNWVSGPPQKSDVGKALPPAR